MSLCLSVYTFSNSNIAQRLLLLAAALNDPASDIGYKNFSRLERHNFYGMFTHFRLEPTAREFFWNSDAFSSLAGFEQ